MSQSSNEHRLLQSSAEDKEQSPNYTELECKEDKDKTKCWLATEITLHDFDIKNQSFEISGWISVFWKWDNAPSALTEWNGNDKENADSFGEKRSNRILYKNKLNSKQEIVKVLDLRDSDLSDDLPIDAKKVLRCLSLHVCMALTIYSDVILSAFTSRRSCRSSTSTRPASTSTRRPKWRTHNSIFEPCCLNS